MLKLKIKAVNKPIYISEFHQLTTSSFIDSLDRCHHHNIENPLQKCNPTLPLNPKSFTGTCQRVWFCIIRQPVSLN